MSEDSLFWEKIDKGGECWLYQGHRNTSGYGWLTRGGKQLAAHRHAWTLINGAIPPGRHVLHHCDNPACVRLDHLYLGDHAANMRDRADRRRCRAQKLSRENVRELRLMRAEGATLQTIADRFCISNGHAHAVANGDCYGRE